MDGVSPRMRDAGDLRRSGSVSRSSRKRRTRASVACEHCRTRKTRCDSRRPTCGYCSMHGVACRYPDDATSGPDGVHVSNSAILARVNQAVALLEDLQRDHQVFGQQPSTLDASASATQPDYSDSHQKAGRVESAFADDGFGQVDISNATARDSACESLLRWPILQSLGANTNIRSLGLEAAATSTPEHPTKHGGVPQDRYLELCQRFLTLVHVKNPILDVPEFTQYARSTAEFGPGWDAGGCLVLLACSLASVAVPYSPEEGGYSRQAALEDTVSAEAYYEAAQRRFGLLQPSLISCQCQYLAGLYCKFVIRPMQAWTLLQSASAKLQAMLYAKSLVPRDALSDRHFSRARHIEQRLYWSCVKSESEIRIDLQLPSTGKTKYPDLFPSLSLPSTSELPPMDTSPQGSTPSQGLTPWSPAAWQSNPETEGTSPGSALQPEEERSWLYYLAEISLRSQMSKVLSGLYGTHIGSWASQTGALRHQQAAYIDDLNRWHATLPQQLAFHQILPLGQLRSAHSRPSNELAFFLQTRYIGTLEWIYRPSLELVIHRQNPASDHDQQNEMAAKAIDAAAALILQVAAHHRHGGIWGLLRRSFGAALSLIAAATYCNRVSRQSESTPSILAVPADWMELVELAITTIGQWEQGNSTDLTRMTSILREILACAMSEIRG